MKKLQTGFTMIELIVVIVILGVLAATALPRFVDLRGDAQEAALAGMAGNASSAMSINLAGCTVANNAVGARCVQVNNCDDLDDVLQGGLPDDYSVTAAPIATNGQAVQCTLTLTGFAQTAQFTAFGAGI